MIEKFYFRVQAQGDKVLTTSLCRGRFINYKHFIACLTYWSGHSIPYSYFFYPGRDDLRPESMPELLDHTTTLAHFA